MRLTSRGELLVDRGLERRRLELGRPRAAQLAIGRADLEARRRGDTGVLRRLGGVGDLSCYRLGVAVGVDLAGRGRPPRRPSR